MGNVKLSFGNSVFVRSSNQVNLYIILSYTGFSIRAEDKYDFLRKFCVFHFSIFDGDFCFSYEVKNVIDE